MSMPLRLTTKQPSPTDVSNACLTLDPDRFTPTGPKTIHFWAPTFKWGISIANIADFKRPADQVRGANLLCEDTSSGCSSIIERAQLGTHSHSAMLQCSRGGAKACQRYLLD